jgi:uncharacterized protein YeaO (DUF488 family)
MLRQTSLLEVRQAKIPRAHSHIVVTMRYYPRFLKKDLRDEYVCSLAPPKELLADFNRAKTKFGDHERAFKAVRYEKRFSLTEEGLEHLKRLVALSKKRDVYFVCICPLGECCHREMLLLLARQRYKARIGKVSHAYPVFARRLLKGEFS